GFVRVARQRPLLGAVLALWVAPMWAMLSVQENWEELKMTYLVLLLPPAAVALAAGIDAPRAPGRGALVRTARRTAALAATTAAGGAAAPPIARAAAPGAPGGRAPFPPAAVTPPGFAELPQEKRGGGEFSHTAESPAELARERARLVPPRLLPAPYR